MFIFIATFHIIISILLVVLVLLQNPKGGALGFLGGQSGSKSVFSSTGASDFLLTATKWCAVIFALTSIQLAYMSSKRNDSVILNPTTTETQGLEEIEAPVETAPENNETP